MKQIFLMMLVLNTAITSAQDKAPFNPSRLPTDANTNLFTYVEVIQMAGVNAKELYARGLKWFNTFYKNPTDVIRSADSTKGEITGKARFKIYKQSDKSNLRTDAGSAEYTITLSCKDGKYRYKITDINWKQASYFPAERWLDTKAQTYSPSYFYYLEQMDSIIVEVIDNLETAMKTSTAKKKDDW